MLGAEGHPSSDRPCAQPGSHSQAPRGCGAIGDHVKDHPKPHILVAFHVEMGFGEMPGANLGLLPGNYRLTILFPFLLIEFFQLLVLMPWACPWSILGEMQSGGGWVTSLQLALA